MRPWLLDGDTSLGMSGSGTMTSGGLDAGTDSLRWDTTGLYTASPLPNHLLGSPNMGPTSPDGFLLPTGLFGGMGGDLSSHGDDHSRMGFGASESTPSSLLSSSFNVGGLFGNSSFFLGAMGNVDQPPGVSEDVRFSLVTA